MVRDSDFQTRVFDTAHEFLDALSPTHPDWLPDTSVESPWIFRGQSDASLSLIPSAWRQDEGTMAVMRPLLAHAEERIPSLPQNSQGISPQSFAENLAVKKFVALCDEVGERLPQMDFHREIVADSKSPFWPGPRSALTCLAQHHRVPTRLLDWTRRPLVAGFFAAQGQTPAPGSRLVVWALRSDTLPSEIELVTAPRAENSFLHVQHGVFTLDTRGEDECSKTGSWRGLESVVPIEHMWRLVLASSEALELRRLLRAHQVTAAHLMPELGTVAAELKSRIADGH